MYIPLSVLKRLTVKAEEKSNSGIQKGNNFLGAQNIELNHVLFVTS